MQITVIQVARVFSRFYIFLSNFFITNTVFPRYTIIVVFIPLYTLADFTFLPPYNASFLFPFTTFIFPKLLFYHFPFPYIRFSSSAFPMSSLPASPRYFFQSVSSCLSFSSVITFSQFVASYFTHIFLPDVTFAVLLSS